MDHDRPTQTDPAPAPRFTPATEPVPPAPVVAGGRTVARPASRSGRLVNVALGAALVVAIGGAAFAVGRATTPASTTGGLPDGLRGQFPNASFVPGLGQRFGGGLSLEGTVVSVDSATLELETVDGRTIEVALDADTAYHAQAAASASDVTSGASVIVRLTGGDGGPVGPAASGAPGLTGGTASEVTIVP
jgi:hypothetical protein